MKSDLDRFIELFDSVGINYELDQTAENLNYLLTKEFMVVFTKTNKFIQFLR